MGAVDILVVPSRASDDGRDGDGRMRFVITHVARVHRPDLIFWCNEHTFVIAENLRCYADGLDPQEPLYLGNRFRKEPPQVRQSPSGPSNRLLSGLNCLPSWARLRSCRGGRWHRAIVSPHVPFGALHPASSPARYRGTSQGLDTVAVFL